MVTREPRKTFGVRATRAVVLASFGSLVFFVSRAVPETHGEAWLIAAIGFLLIAGALTSELLEVIGLPHITGYLLAGMVAGPYALRLFDERTVEDLSPVNTLALSLIALAGGAELELTKVRKALRSLSWALVSQFLFNLLGAAATFLAVRRLVPFARGLPTAALFGMAIL